MTIHIKITNDGHQECVVKHYWESEEGQIASHTNTEADMVLQPQESVVKMIYGRNGIFVIEK